MINFYKPALDIAKAIIEKVPPWVWAVLVLGAVWVGTVYAAVVYSAQINDAVWQTKLDAATVAHQVQLAKDIDENQSLKAGTCGLRVMLARCEATAAATPKPAPYRPRPAPKPEPEIEECQ